MNIEYKFIKYLQIKNNMIVFHCDYNKTDSIFVIKNINNTEFYLKEDNDIESSKDIESKKDNNNTIVNTTINNTTTNNNNNTTITNNNTNINININNNIFYNVKLIQKNDCYSSYINDNYFIRIISPATDFHFKKYKTKKYKIETYTEYEKIEKISENNWISNLIKNYSDNNFIKNNVEKIYSDDFIKNNTENNNTENNKTENNPIKNKTENNPIKNNETEKIYYYDNNFIIIKDYKWCNDDIKDLYFLLIFKNIKYKTLREADIEILENAKKIIYECLIKYYKNNNICYKNIKEEILIYFHYHPTYYVMHLHIVSIFRKVDDSMSVGRAVLLDDVIYNIKIDNEYYKKKDMYFLG